jgi:competence protein ComEA
MDPQPPAWRLFEAPGAGEAPGPAGAASATAPGAGLRVLGASGPALAGLAAAVVLGVAAIAIATGGLAGVGAGSGGGGEPSPSLEAGADGELVIEVVGAVARPGIYRLAAGARVGDAIAAAGGFGPRVDADRVAAQLNLAAPLRDGDRVVVPSRDDAAAVASDGSGPRSSPGLVDLNHASAEELDALPGIGPATAAKIIAARAEAPFRTVDELRSRGLVGQKTFDKLKSLVTVG